MTFEEAITSGGDERIELKDTGLNKYHVNPLQSDGVLNRGSCTCSALGRAVEPQVRSLFHRLKGGDDLDIVRQEQRARMKALLLNDGGKGFDICFAPSGSDLCFYPLLFSALINPNKPIMNLITCPEELGTGSVLANRGLFFSEKTQLQPVEKGSAVNDGLQIDYRTFPSRTPEGEIIDHKPMIYEAMKEFKDSHNVLVHLVIGSKSGIESNLSIIEEGPKDVIYVVDLCQMRAVPKMLHHLIGLDCMVMITGSKFYQSPPFCGALIVPDTYGDQLRKVTPTEEQMAGFSGIYTKYDLPPSYSGLRAQLEDYRNLGTTLRWEAAICESENLSKYTEREVTFAISLWNKHIVDYLQSKPVFELMRDQDKTNRSIISFLVKGKDGFFSNARLKELYEHLLTHGHTYQSKYKKLTIGQPVEYEEHSFIRLALGSTNVRQLIDSEIDLADDYMLIDIIEQIAIKMDSE